MTLLKKLILAFFISTAMLITASPVLAGKVENPTAQEVTKAIEDTLAGAENIVIALGDGTEKNEVLALFKATKQFSKGIIFNPIDKLRQRAGFRMVKSRSALKKGNIEEAIEFANKAVKIYKKLQQEHKDF